MPAGKYDIIIEQGATFSRVITWDDEDGEPVNVTGYTARAQFRASHGSTSTVLSLTSPSSGLVLGGALGTITMTITATATAALTAPSFGVWDLELVSATSVVTRLLEGTYQITPEVTK